MKPGALSLRRNRDFRLVWLGQTTSALGSGMTKLAYPLLMLMITGSPAAAGALVAAGALPYLIFGLPAGALADRWNRRRTMVICEMVRAINMATIPLALLLGVLSSAQLYVTAFIGGVAYVSFTATQAPCLPNIVDKQQLTSAISAQETAEAACSVASGPLGGALMQWLRGIPFLFDALSYMVSAACFAAVRSDFRSSDHPVEHSHSLRSDIAAGIRWLWRNRVLRAIALTAAGLQLAISGISLVTIVIAEDTGASASAIGVLFSAIGAGGIAGAALAPRIRQIFGVGGTILVVVWVHAALWMLVAFAHTLLVVGTVVALFTLTMPWLGIAAYGYQLEVTPDDLLGRVGTAFNLLLWAATPAAGILAGELLEAFSPRTVSIAFACWLLLLAALATTSTTLRGVDDGHGSMRGCRRDRRPSPRDH